MVIAQCMVILGSVLYMLEENILVARSKAKGYCADILFRLLILLIAC